MAEIRVEPQRGGKRWLWVLIALIVVAALCWYFLGNRTTAVTPAPAPATTP